MQPIRETATITSKGQVTLPKSIRNALGVSSGTKLSFELQGDRVMVRPLKPTEHQDPAIAEFLNLIFAWVNDAQTLRNAGGRSAPYAVFEKMLTRGNPPDDWGTSR